MNTDGNKKKEDLARTLRSSTIETIVIFSEMTVTIRFQPLFRFSWHEFRLVVTFMAAA